MEGDAVAAAGGGISPRRPADQTYVFQVKDEAKKLERAGSNWFFHVSFIPLCPVEV